LRIVENRMELKGLKAGMSSPDGNLFSRVLPRTSPGSALVSLGSWNTVLVVDVSFPSLYPTIFSANERASMGIGLDK
jgi:hypothetical protein